MKKLTAILFVLILSSGCAREAQPQVPKETPTEEKEESKASENPCLSSLAQSAGEAYDYAKEKTEEAVEASKKAIAESQEDGVLKDASDKIDEMKDRAGKAIDAFMED